MSTIPKFASNKKYWQILNKLVFGDEVSCPRCRASLQENYCNKYLWCKLCRKKYRPTSYQAVCPLSKPTAERQHTMPDSRRCCPDRRKLF